VGRRRRGLGLATGGKADRSRAPRGAGARAERRGSPASLRVYGLLLLRAPIRPPEGEGVAVAERFPLSQGMAHHLIIGLKKER